MDPSGVDLELWKRKHIAGRYWFHPDTLQAPSAKFACREAWDREHIMALKTSFRQSATVNEEFVGAIVDDDVFELCQEQGVFKNQNRNCFSPTELMQLLQIESLPVIHTIGGDHSRVAMSELREKFPLNASFKQCNTMLLVCKDNAETVRMLGMLGNLDNMKQRKKPGFAEWVMGMHRRCEAVNGFGDSQYEAQVRADMMFSAKIDKNNIGHMWSLAKREGDYWDLIRKIITGRFEQGTKGIRNKTPNSVSAFTTLGGVPDYLAVLLLKEVCANRMSFQSMKSEIALWKNSRRIKFEAAMFLAECGKIDKPAGLKQGRMNKGEVQDIWHKYFDDYVAVEFHTLNDTWVEAWADSIKKMSLKVNDKMPEEFKDSLLKQWDAARRNKRRRNAAQVR